MIEKQKQERLQELEKVKEKRLAEKAEYEKALADAQKTTLSPLYKKLERKYEKKVLIPELNKKKDTLKSIRELHKPLNHNSIREHARAYSQKRNEVIQKLKEEREQKIKTDMKTMGSRNKSMFLLNVMQTERDKKEKEKIKSAEIADLYHKKKNYGELVKQMHKPMVSRRKQIEMEINKAKLKHIPKTSTLGQSHSQVNKVSLLSTDNSDGVSGMERQGSPTPSIGKSEYRSYFSENAKLKPIRRWKPNELKPQSKAPKVAKVTDWLLERRKRKEQEEYDMEYDQKHRKSQEPQWKHDAKKLDNKDKADYLLEKAKQIEEKAKLKDKHNKIIENDARIDEECDNLLIDALKARLAVLEDA